MKEIGGYFEFQPTSDNRYYHKDAIHLNSGRNALRYILLVQNIKKLYIPFYICNSVIEVLEYENIEYDFYHINTNFEIIDNISLYAKEKILYVNYFGLKDSYIYDDLFQQYSSSELILDKTQAYYSYRRDHTDTFYSPRKFFGVADGGLLYTDFKLDQNIDRDVSAERMIHLFGRCDLNASAYYPAYKVVEESLCNQPIKSMSKLSSALLDSQDDIQIRNIRERNFLYLHTFLAKFNEFYINVNKLNGPMVYPFVLNDSKLRTILIQNKIYVATYWIEVLDKVSNESVEASIVNNLLPLPIDQRYDLTDMQNIVSIIKEYFNAST